MSQKRCKAHKYEKVTNKEKGTTFFKCQACPHSCSESQVLGHLAICCYCSNEFIMNKEVLLKKPHCGCRFRKRNEALKTVETKIDTDKLDALIKGVLS